MTWEFYSRTCLSHPASYAVQIRRPGQVRCHCCSAIDTVSLWAVDCSLALKRKTTNRIYESQTLFENNTHSHWRRAFYVTYWYRGRNYDRGLIHLSKVSIQKQMGIKSKRAKKKKKRKAEKKIRPVWDMLGYQSVRQFFSLTALCFVR